MTGLPIIDFCLYAIFIAVSSVVVLGCGGLIFGVIISSMKEDYEDYKLKYEFTEWKQKKIKDAQLDSN
jgi:hypothetical protein